MSSSNKDNETVAKIVEEMRDEWALCYFSNGIRRSDSEYSDVHAVYSEEIAARIEVAHDREIKALEWKIENFAKVVECKDREIKAKDAKIEELRECLRIIRDNLLSYTIKSDDGKYVNNGGFLSEEFVDDERWRKALEGSDNEAE